MTATMTRQALAKRIVQVAVLRGEPTRQTLDRELIKMWIAERRKVARNRLRQRSSQRYEEGCSRGATSGKGHYVVGISRAARLHAESLLPESYMNVRPNKETARDQLIRRSDLFPTAPPLSPHP